MTSYDRNIVLEQKFTSIIKGILGNQFIGQDAVHDRQEATDFEIFTVRPFKVGARLRRYEYLERYSKQFTIRWSLPSGLDTEIHKIRRGLVDYILYGFVSKDESHIEQYFIGDLGIFRMHEPKPLGIYPNNPPDSMLAAYELVQFPPAFVMKFWQRKT